MTVRDRKGWRMIARAGAFGAAVAMAPALAGAEIPADCRQDTDLAVKTAACSAVIASDAPADDRAEALYERARVHRDGDGSFVKLQEWRVGPGTGAALVEALDDARGAIRLAPGVARYWVLAGRLLTELGETAAAKAHLDRAEQFGADSLDLLLARAGTQVQEERGDEAEESLGQVLARDPNNVDALRLRARLAFERGDFATMLELFEEVMRLAPGQARSHLDRGIANYLTGNQDLAEADLAEAVRLDPKSVEAYKFLGIVQLRQGRPDAARGAFEEMVALEPRDPESHAYLGLALSSLGEARAARAEFGEVMIIDSNFASRLANLARIWSGLGRTGLMMETFDFALLIQPRNTWLIGERASARMELGETDAAIADYTLAIDITRRDPATYNELIWAYENRARAYLAAGKSEAAVRDFQAALDTARPPARWILCFGYARDLHEKGVTEAAGAFYQTCLKSAPGDPNGNFGYAQLLADEGRLDEAIARYATALEAAQARGWGVREITSDLSYRGDALLDKGEADAALKLFTMVAQALPDDSEAQEDIAAAWRAKGDLPRAIEEYDKAIALNPENRTAWRYRGDCHAALGDAAAAIADYTQAIAVDPEYKQAFKRRGDALAEMLGDREAAIRDYSRALEIDPDYMWALTTRRNVYYDMGHYAEALQDADRAIELSPEDGSGYFSRGRIDRMLGDADGASRDFRRAGELGSHYAAIYLFLMRWADDRDGAVAELRAHETTLPEGEWPRPVMAHLVGDLPLERLYDLATDVGKLCEAKFYGGWLLQLRDQPAEAIALFHEAAAICPRDFVEYEDVLRELDRLGEAAPR